MVYETNKLLEQNQGDKAFIIAEVAQAHDGSLGILHSYIDAVAKTGADAIKFQTHIAEAESSPSEPFRIKFSYEDETRQEYWRRMEFTIEQWGEIKKHCETVGLEFISTPSCVSALELLERLGIKRYKIGSGDTVNNLLLHRAAETGKQIILSTGVNTYDEIDDAVRFVSGFGNSIVIMQCTSEYPVPHGKTGLNLISHLRSRYKHSIGLSDHSGTIYPSLAAVALGASYIETHIVFDRRMFGPDSTSSLTIDETKTMVEGIRAVEQSLYSNYNKSRSVDGDRMKDIFGKSLAIRRDMVAGEIIEIKDLESKKPSGMGIGAKDYMSVIGRRLKIDVSKWGFLREDNIE